MHVRLALGYDRFARSNINVYVFRVGIFVHARRACRVALHICKPEEHLRRVCRIGGRIVEQFERRSRIRGHVRQLRPEVFNGLSVRNHLRPLHSVYIVLKYLIHLNNIVLS